MPELNQCRQQILSNDYRDFIVGQFAAEEFESFITLDTCQQQTEFAYSMIHLERTQEIGRAHV